MNGYSSYGSQNLQRAYIVPLASQYPALPGVEFPPSAC